MRAENASAKTPPAAGLLHALRRFGRVLSNAAPRRRAARLDPRDLSDHLKRDLGLLDGGPRNPRP